MRKFIIASHGSLSKGIIDSATMIAGNINNVQYLSVNPGDGQEIIHSKIKQLINPEMNTEIVILTDLLGGSVTNAFIDYIKDYNIQIVTGVNLPLVLEMLLSDQSIELNELLNNAIQRGREGIVHVNSFMS